MNKSLFLLFFLAGGLAFAGMVLQALEEDLIKTAQGDLKLTFIGHGSLMATFDQKIIHVDPVAEEGDYSQLPKADLILVTHEHFDHLDSAAIEFLRKPSTQLIYTEKCAEKMSGGAVMKNGETKMVLGIKIEAVPAYNIRHMRSPGQPFHPKGQGNGYILTCGDKRVYIAGDTENIPEMKELKGIDVAFLPMNLPYTMTPEMVAEAARWIRPKILYPYHYGETDTSKLQKLLTQEKNIEVRIRKLK
jgi:L-ascorbate metabolism protein UlaG (beta-lactamase superfamily)